jgi:hypothetical protein
VTARGREAIGPPCPGCAHRLLARPGQGATLSQFASRAEVLEPDEGPMLTFDGAGFYRIQEYAGWLQYVLFAPLLDDAG